MRCTDDPRQPRVFLSFAGEDRPSAEFLGKSLRALDLDTFVDEANIRPGNNLVLDINDAIEVSDHFLLLWSRHTVGNPWVATEWSTALMRDLDSKRSFLFTVRLDQTSMPTILVPRKYLDACGDWDAVADKLAATWRSDLDMGLPVLPAPAATARQGARRSMSTCAIASFPWRMWSPCPPRRLAVNWRTRTGVAGVEGLRLGTRRHGRVAARIPAQQR